MINDELKIIDDAKDSKEVLEIAFTLVNLKIQTKVKNRNGMIAALKNAQSIAEKEIINTINQTGSVYSKPWDMISDDELYYMLFQYKDGLMDKGMKKVGEKAFKEMCEYAEKCNNSHN